MRILRRPAELGGALLLVLAGCGSLPGHDAADRDVLVAVGKAAGDATGMEFTDVRWCPDRVNDVRAAAVYAVGDTTYGTESGAGLYLVEVMPDGSVGRPVKANILDPNIDPEAMRVDQTYCDGQLVVRYRDTMRQLDPGMAMDPAGSLP